jgi:hypothetical protein
MIFNNKKEKEINKLQWKHLIQIAKHEQGNILQPLIYDDPRNYRMDFPDYLWVMRKTSAIMPDMKLVFNAGCEEYSQEILDEISKKSLNQEETVSYAPDDMILEDYKSRMDWIEQAAKDYHKLMRENPDYMENELISIASWDNEQDRSWSYFNPS